MPEGIVLAFDFGMMFTGVAIGETITRRATPLTILKVKDGIPTWHDVDTLQNRFKPIAMVIGNPANLPDDERQVYFGARKFARRLHARYKIPVHQVDENFSTREAHIWLDEHNLKRKHTDRIDDIAACVLLEQYFNDPRSKQL